MKAFLTLVAVAGIAGFAVWHQTHFYHMPDTYVIQYVESGKVHVINQKTHGETDIYDDYLVRACLKGELKKGDVIKR